MHHIHTNLLIFYFQKVQIRKQAFDSLIYNIIDNLALIQAA
jgi:hypothetical protein